MKAAGSDVPQLLAQQESFPQLTEALARHGAAIAEGLWGSSARALAAALLRHHKPPVCLYCLAHIGDAEDARDELAFYTRLPVSIFPAWESLPSGSVPF